LVVLAMASHGEPSMPEAPFHKLAKEDESDSQSSPMPMVFDNSRSRSPRQRYGIAEVLRPLTAPETSLLVRSHQPSSWQLAGSEQRSAQSPIEQPQGR
jgi:hypothetical protein